MKGFAAVIVASCLAMASAAPAAGNGTVPDASGSSNSTGSASGTNVQAFTGSLGGTAPPVIQTSGSRPFSVNGDTFVGVKAALGRSCDVQHNACAAAANSGALTGGVQQCDEQNTACHAANSLRKRDRRDVRPSVLEGRAGEGMADLGEFY